MQKGNVEASRVQLWRWVVSRDWEIVVGIESRVCCGELEEAGSVSAGTPHWLRALRLRSRHHRVMRSYKTNITSGLSLGNAKLKKHHKSGPSSHHQNFTNIGTFEPSKILNPPSRIEFSCAHRVGSAKNQSPSNFFRRWPSKNIPGKGSKN